MAEALGTCPGRAPRGCRLVAMPECSATPPEDSSGLRLECLGTLPLSPGPCSYATHTHTHTLWYPLQPVHTPLTKSQLSILPSLSSGSLGTIPGPTTPLNGLAWAILGDSPGRSTSHLGFFWSMRTDCPKSLAPWPGLAALGQFPLAWGGMRKAVQWLQEQRKTLSQVCSSGSGANS